jgi:hypothetical protein
MVFQGLPQSSAIARKRLGDNLVPCYYRLRKGPLHFVSESRKVEHPQSGILRRPSLFLTSRNAYTYIPSH